MKLDIKIGDVVLAGKFKNKRVVIKSLETDELGQPTYNGGKSLLKVRIEKSLPKDKQSKQTREKIEESKMIITKKQLTKLLEMALRTKPKKVICENYTPEQLQELAVRFASIYSDQLATALQEEMMNHLERQDRYDPTPFIEVESELTQAAAETVISGDAYENFVEGKNIQFTDPQLEEQFVDMLYAAAEKELASVFDDIAQASKSAVAQKSAYEKDIYGYHGVKRSDFY